MIYETFQLGELEMMINEEELREVIRNLLLEKRLDFSRYKGAYSAGLYKKLVNWARGIKDTSRGNVVYSHPKDFKVEEQYESARDAKSSNSASLDTLMLMPLFAKELNKTATDSAKITAAYNSSLQELENRWDAMSALTPTGQLDDIMNELNTIVIPLNLGLRDVDAQQLAQFFTSEYKDDNDKQEDEARRFLEDVKRAVERFFPKKFKEVKSDIENALSQNLLTELESDKYDALLNKVE